ncbi:YitT family protein [Velocimicrobium porci]|uniref:YitT family protein n=1 Tax=Velocimicrobium porci TaxID=2606634 RepID=A0A6L5XUC2_9FIRM|nr:YitT family protein [Velocimicrobium porci]MSS62365.1 YitT family protein [Velocimicrobium porci]
MKRSLSKNILHLIGILVGNIIYALAVTMFILPNELITGGTTGLALFVNNQTGLSISTFVMIFNILMFILGAVVLGKKFALTTLISTFFYPIALEALQHFPELQKMTQDTLLSTIYAGLMIGFAIGLVIRCGASTGGMDIPPLVLNKKFGLPVSVMLYFFDCLILLSQMLISDKERVLYGILLVLIYTIVLDKVLLFGDSKMQVKIVSEKYEEITDMIIHQLDRGATLLHSETGYCKKNIKVVLSVISNRELPKLNDMVLSIDPNAFMIVNQISQVNGRGFTLEKEYK